MSPKTLIIICVSLMATSCSHIDRKSDGIEYRLNQNVELQETKYTTESALTTFRHISGLGIMIDGKSVEDVEVTFPNYRITLKEMLNLTLSQSGLEYEVRDGFLVIRKIGLEEYND